LLAPRLGNRARVHRVETGGLDQSHDELLALPTVAAQARHYDVGKATITRTLRLPADEGLVKVVPRCGTFKT